jgi:hypothetical protein
LANKIALSVEVNEDPSEFTNSIQQVEKLEDRVQALSADTVELKKQKEAVTAQLRAFDQEIARGTKLTQDQARQVEQLTLRDKELANSLQRSKFSLGAARQELSNLNFAQRDAAQNAQLLASTFGVQLPQSLTTFATRIPVVQRNLSSALNASIWVAFAGAAVVAISEVITKYQELATEAERFEKERLRALSEFERGFLGDVGGGIRRRQLARFPEADRPGEEARRQIQELLEQEGAQRRLGRAATIAELPPDMQAAVLEIQKTADFDRQQILRKQEEQRAARQEGLERRLADLDQREREQGQQGNRVFVGPGAITPDIPSADPAVVKAAADRIKAIEDREERIKQIEENANIARLQGHQRTIAQINAEERRRFEEFKRTAGDIQLTAEELERARVAFAIDAEAQRMEVFRAAAEEQARAIEQYGHDLESLFDRTIGSARSAKEALANIWRELAREWKSQIFQQIAQATFPGARGGNSSGGLLGSIIPGLGGIFSGSSSGGGTFGSGPVNGDPRVLSFSGGSASDLAFGSALASGGLSAAAAVPLGFGGAISPATTPATTAALFGLPATTPTGTVLGSLGLGAIAPALPAAGLALAGIGTFARGRGPIAGAAIGAGIGIGGLALAGGLLAPSLGLGFGAGALLGLGSLGGPVGLAIAGVAAGIGALFGLSGRGKDKVHDTQIENAGFAQIKQLVADYERHRRDYASTFDAMFDVHEDIQAAFVRSQSRRNEQFWFDRYLEHIGRIEDERNRRRQVLGALPLPEFHEGGFVGFAGWAQRASGEVPAVLRRGEYVMQESAVQRLGTRLLDGMNMGTVPPSGQLAVPDDYEVVLMKKVDLDQAVEDAIPRIIVRGGRASRILRG